MCQRDPCVGGYQQPGSDLEMGFLGEDYVVDMTNGRRISALGVSLGLGLLAFAWSFLLAAQQPGGGSISLRMSKALGEAERAADNSASSRSTSNTKKGGSDGGRRSGARGVSLELSTGLRSDDNVFRSTFNTQRDVIVETKPKIYLDGRLGKHSFRLGYEGKLGRYQQFRGENYFDHKLLGAMKFDFDRRLKANLKTSLEYGHDARGDLATRTTLSATPDRWHKHDISSEMILGRRIAKAQIGAKFGISGIRYMNNSQGLRDFDENDLRLFGRYNLTPRFTLLGELSGAWTDYLNPASDQSAREFIGLGGIAWEATAKTSGQIKVGIRHRDFNTAGIPSTTGLTWDAKLVWSPKSYSKVTAYTSREVNASARQGSGGLTSTDTYGLKWRHSLTRKLRFETGFQRAQAGISDILTDRLFDFNAGIRYQMNRWIDLTANWKYSSLSSSDGRSDFEANSVFIGFDAKLSRRLKGNKE